MAERRPKKVDILGTSYSVEYCEKPSDVDLYKRESLWGQVDYWTRSIRIYDHERSDPDVWQTLLHEVLHAIATDLHLKVLGNKENHDELDLVALALIDILLRNGWLKWD